MVFIEVQPVPGLSLMRQGDSNWHDSSVWGKKKRKLLWVCNLSFSILLIEHVEQDNGGVGSVTQIQPSVLLWEKCHTHHFATIFSPVRNWLQTFVYAS